jgi:ADP-heptose:LPS heptosyltransferase
LDAIGDALTTVPLIAALRRHGMTVSAVLRPHNADVFASHALQTVHVINGEDVIADIRRQRYDCALIATEKAQGYRVAAKARIPIRIGFENGWGKPFKTLWVRRMCTRTIFRTAGLDRRAPHECEVVFKLGGFLLPDAEPPRDPALLRAVVLDNIPDAQDRITVQITEKWERLGAPIREVAQLVGRIAAQHPIRLVGAEYERAYCQRIAEATQLTVETFASVREWKEAIAASRALVAPDSGAVHVAGMIGTKVVACFGSRNFALQTARWQPWASANRMVKIEDGTWPLVAADALGLLLTDSAPSIYKG